jgi:nickel-dependent lactate racemase
VVKIDKRFAKAELRIATGLVEPHFMAGYSGGRKVITPGVAHQDTIRRIHTARFMEDPKAVNCQIADNPLHEEQIEIVGMLGGALSVNTVITEHRELSFVNFGEIQASHLAGGGVCAALCRGASWKSPSAPWSPPARDIPWTKPTTRPSRAWWAPWRSWSQGGDIFIVSEISEGFGSPEYLEAQKRFVELGMDGFWPTSCPSRPPP